MKARAAQLALLGGFVLLSSLIGLVLPKIFPPNPRRPPRKHVTEVRQEPTFAQLQMAIPQIGARYSVDNADGGFRVIKVLGASANSATVTLFGNHFPTRPRSIDVGALSLEPGRGYEGPGLDSLSVTPRAFAVWKPQPIEVTAR